MPSTLDIAALSLCRTLAAATGGAPMQWRSLALIARRAGIPANRVDAVVMRCKDKGWLILEGGHSVCLTDAGRTAVA